MGTYFALMEKEAERGEDYQDLGKIKEVLLIVQKGRATPEEAYKVLKYLDRLEERVTEMMKDSPPPPQAQTALVRLEDLKSALATYANIAHK